MSSRLLQFSTAASGERSPPSLSSGFPPRTHSRLIQPDEQGAGGRAGGHSWLSTSCSPTHSRHRARLQPLPRVRDSSSCL
nr:unnamed protein product [Rangifer tarandus platyrhynchus]